MLHRVRGQPTGITTRHRASRDVPPLGLRVRVWAQALELDRQLADGVAPTSSPELILRAHQLASARSRRALAGGLTRVVDAAARPREPWTPTAPIVTTRVLEAAGPLVSLARDLKTISNPSVRAIAMVSCLMCDAPTSPLYNHGSPVTVRDIVQQTRSALTAMDDD
jgi:hypothetical protein